MKRLIIPILILVCIAVFCPAQIRGRRPLVQKYYQLNEPNLTGPVSLEEALVRQKNVNRVVRRNLQTAHLGQLAWAGLGIDRRLARQPMPTEPVFPLRLYMATPEGLFLYQPVPHRLEQVIDRDIRPALATDTTTPAPVAGAGCDILLVGSPRSVPSMSLNKGRDFLCTEAGRALQNIQLQAICLDLPYTTIPEFNAKNMAQTCQLTRDMEVFGIISVGIMSGPMALEPAPQTPVAAKKAVLIVPAANFQDEEFFETVTACESASIQTVVASIRRGVIRGIQSRPIEVGILINQLEPADYDSFIFIGGPGVSDLAGDPAVLNIIREGVRLKKIVAASSTAAILLADAGVIKGFKVTGYIAEQERLVKAGATYTGKPVEQDRRIITSAGPAVAAVFAKTVANAIIAAK